MKVVIDHSCEDSKDMLLLDHTRCKELEKEITRVLKKWVVEENFLEAHATEELAKTCNDIQEYTYVMRQFYMTLEKMNAMEKNPIGSLFGMLFDNLNRE